MSGWLWPCTDLPGSRIASNLAGGNPLFVTTSKYGTAGGTQSFGGNSSAIPGAAGAFLISPQYQVSSQSGMWGQVIATPGGFGGYSLVGAGSDFPAITNGVTLEFWFQITGSPAPTAPVSLLGLSSVKPSNNGMLSLFVDSLAPTLIQIRYSDGTVATVATMPASLLNATAPTHVAMTLTTTAWTTYVNGAETSSGSFPVALPPKFAYMILNGNAGANASFLNPFTGFIGWVAIFPRVLHPLRILTHYQAGITGMAGDAASYRAERILAASGTAILRRLIQYETPFTSGGGGPDAVVSCSDWAGSPAGQAINNIAGSTPPGMTFVTPGGELFALSKEQAFGQPSKWVLGEDVDAGEIPYLTDFALGYDDQHVANDVQLTQLDTQAIVTSQVPAVTSASADQFGQQTVNDTGHLQGDATVPLDFGPGLYDQANWLATTFRKPLTRGEVITVDASRFASAWPFVLGASVGDMVTLNRRPLGLAPPGVISIPGRISQTTRDIAFGHGGTVIGSIQCIIDAAPEAYVLTCDDPVLGQLDGRNCLSWLPVAPRTR